jgi:hypothetical protein
MRVLLQRLLDEAEARQLPALIAEWADRSDTLRWVAIALQLDLPLLIERPELVIPCLVRRCIGFDEVEPYYQRAQAPVDARELRELVEEWVAAWEARGAWLRAVRPPQYPLEAGIVEEYRTSATGTIRFSDDDELVGVVGEDEVIGWERATGRRIDGRGRIRKAEPRWRLARGTRVLTSSERDVPFVVREGENPYGVIELDDERVLVTCSYEEDPYDDGLEYSHYLVETDTGRVIWRARGACRAARVIEDRIFLIDDEVVIRYLASGEECARYAMPYSREATFSARGLLAVRDDSVIRIWDLARVPAKVPRGRVHGKVELSPDGTRAMVGHSLVDAHAGTTIAQLPIRGTSGFLEGGPPTNYIALLDRFAIEVMPWGAQIWSTHDGGQVADRVRTLGANAGDVVCYDPRGRYMAIVERRGRLRLHRLPGGALVLDGKATVTWSDDGRSIAFSDDGGQLWWRNDAGEDWVVNTEEPRVPRRGEPPVKRARPQIDCRDGLLVVGEAAAPVDESTVVVADGGRSFLGPGDHYRLIT